MKMRDIDNPWRGSHLHLRWVYIILPIPTENGYTGALNLAIEVLMDLEHPDRIRWACRRGMLELDILLLGFFDGAYASLPEPLKHQFIDLLESADQDLHRWLLSYENAPESFQPICKRIRDYHRGHSS